MKTEYRTTLANAVVAAYDAAHASDMARVALGKVVSERPARTTVADLIVALPPEARRLLPERQKTAEGVLSKAVTVWEVYFAKTGMPEKLPHTFAKLYENRPKASGKTVAELLAAQKLPARPQTAKRATQTARKEGDTTVTLPAGTIQMLQRYADAEKVPTLTAAIQRLITQELERREKVATGKRKRAARKTATGTA